MTGIGRSKLYELIKAGEIETVKVGSRTLVTVAGLKAFLEKCRGERTMRTRFRGQSLTGDSEVDSRLSFGRRR
ncbi:helix-turn-helix domain-containing protein, partial [Sphingosinicella xenopeptidilytica]